MSWSEFLIYASGPGVGAIVGVLLSELAGYWAAFENLDAKGKRVVMFMMCLAVPVVASALGVFTADWAASWENTYWPALVSGFTAFTASQAVHTRKLGRI